MNISEINRVLEENGLSNKEARTYTSLLGLGITTPYQVAKKSGLKAPITYVILEELLKKGLVLKTPYKSGWRFQARSINDYLEERYQATNSLSSVSNTINSLIHSTSQSNILYFEGIAEIETALRYKIDSTNDFVAFYGSTQNISTELSEIFLRWYKELHKRKIQKRIIAPRDLSLSTYRQLDAEFGNEVKEVNPDVYSSESSIEVHKDFIRIVLLKKNTCIIIEDENLPLVLRNIFDLVWNVV